VEVGTDAFPETTEAIVERSLRRYNNLPSLRGPNVSGALFLYRLFVRNSAAVITVSDLYTVYI